MLNRLRPLTVVVLAALLVTGGAGAVTRTFNLTLRGADAVPPGDRGDSAKAIIKIDSAKGRICWTFTNLRGIGTSTHPKIG